MRELASVKVVLLFLVALPAFSQHIGLDTDKIETLIKEWDFANNARNHESFRAVYADKLLFYT